MEPLLEFKNVSFSYPGKNEALKNVSFKLDSGEKIALLGLNGAGKSTLMLHTNGLLQPSEGEVIVEGISTKSKSLGEIRRIVGLVFQNPDDQLFMPTVKDDVAFGPRNMGLQEKEVKERVEEALKLTNTEELADRFPYDLSGGQKKSVSIATVLSMQPKLLVMDEPTSGLDYEATNNLVGVLNSLPHALLISSHDVEFLKKVCKKAIVIHGGEIIYKGDILSLEYPPK